MPNPYIDTYAAVGNREDLINLITNISPEETVFMSRIGKGKATARNHEFLNEKLQPSNFNNAIVEGAPATFATTDFTVRTRLTNACQILRRNFSTSYTQDTVEKAGIDGTEFDHQRSLKTKEIARDINAALLVQTFDAGSDATPRKLRGALAAITTNIEDAGAAALSQTQFNALLQKIWVEGGKPNAAYVGGFNKRVISNFTVPNDRNIQASDRTVIVSVDTYDSDFGKIMILLEREITASSVLVVEEKYWKTAWLRPLFFEELGKVGEQRRGSVVSEVTLEHLAENSSGKIINTTTA